MQVTGASADPPTPPCTSPSDKRDEGDVTDEEVDYDSDIDGVDSVAAADTSEANVPTDNGEAVVGAVPAAVAGPGALLAPAPRRRR